MSRRTENYTGDIVPIGSQLPYGVDSQHLEYFEGTNNIQSISFVSGGDLVKTRTFTYLNGGAADDDLITSVIDS